MQINFSIKVKTLLKASISSEIPTYLLPKCDERLGGNDVMRQVSGYAGKDEQTAGSFGLPLIQCVPILSALGATGNDCEPSDARKYALIAFSVY